MAVKKALFCVIVFHCTWIILTTRVPITKIYHIQNDTSLPWHDASKHCQKFGMSLLSVKTMEEYATLKEYIENKYGRILPFWLGAFKKNGVWKWLAYDETIEPHEFIWHAGEPNDKSKNELCIHTWERDFDWNDNDCELHM